MAAYGVWVALSEWQAVVSSIASVGWWGLGFILSLSLVNYGLRFVRWHWFLSRMGFREIAWQDDLAYYLSGFALTTTPGKAGEAVRSLYLKRHGVDYPSSLAAFVTERFSDLLSILLIAIAALFHFAQYQVLAIGTGVFLLLFLFFIQHTPSRHLLQKIMLRWLPAKTHMLIGHGFNIVERMTLLLGPGALITGTLLGVLSWGAEAFAFSYILHAMGYELSPMLLAGVYAIAMIAGAVSFLPGGLGSTEAVMTLLLLALGVPNSTAVSATLLCRVTTLWFAVAIGLGALLIAERLRTAAPEPS